MLLSNAITRSLSCIGLASILAMSSGCQKEDLLENQFASAVAVNSGINGQLIDGQYIVVFKNGSVGSTSMGQGLSASHTAAAKMRQQVYDVAGLEKSDVSQIYEGVVNGFAARLTKEQVAELSKNSAIAYIEQDRLISLGSVSTATSPKGGGNTKDDVNLKGNGNGKGGTDTKGDGATSNGKGKPTEPAPTEPTPTDPTPTNPAPTEPAPTEPAPVEPAPSEPAPTEPAAGYTTVTPMEGETLPWNIERVGYGDGTGKTVWIIDSGIDTDHPDLNVDLTRSVSFIYANTSIEDGFGHGTSVAGIIAAKNNGSGIIGVASNATIVALRVFDDAGAGTLSRAIGAVNHVSQYGKPGDVVNMSLGSGMSSTLDNAVMTAAAKGILFAVAAGNSGIDCYETSPARVNAEGVYTVSAMDSYNRLWDRSNFGAAVDVSAPGVNVTSVTKGGGFGGGSYGTSVAAPHVAGILLLRGKVYSQGTITGDKDNTPDPIASVE